MRIAWFLDCNIGLRGAKAIAEALKHNLTLDLLNLNDNHIGDEGAEIVVEALNFNVHQINIH